MTEPARRPARELSDDTPSLDPHAIERAYRRERARRRASARRHHAVRNSGLRFWTTILFLCFLAAAVVLAAWHQVESLFGV